MSHIPPRGIRPFHSFLGRLALFVSTFGFTGMLPRLFGKQGKGGGTIGSAATIIILLCLYKVQLDATCIAWAIGLTLIVGLPAVFFGERYFLKTRGPQKRHTGELVMKDFNETNIDEVHGTLIAVLPIYFYSLDFTQFALMHLCAFALFRLFDVKKFGLVKKVEEAEDLLTSPGAIMLDDTVAGVMAMIPIGMLAHFLFL